MRSRGSSPFQGQLVLEKESFMEPELRQSISEALHSVSEHHSNMVAASSAQIMVYATPFLNRFKVYEVTYFTPNRPVAFYVGFVQGEAAFLLTGNPESYINLSRADGVVVSTPEVAIDYITAYLEVTRSMSGSYYIVSSVDELLFRSDLSLSQESEKESFLESYRDEVKHPAARSEKDGFVVTAYTVSEQKLERLSLTVSRNGEIEMHRSVLENELPLVYGL